MTEADAVAVLARDLVRIDSRSSLSNLPVAERLEAELRKISRYGLIVIDEVGYIPFDTEAANLFFQLVSSRYERASLIVTSNKPFGRWGEVFGDEVVAAAMIDRLVHHAEVIALKGDSYRLKQSVGRRRTSARAEQNQATPEIVDSDTGEIIIT